MQETVVEAGAGFKQYWRDLWKSHNHIKVDSPTISLKLDDQYLNSIVRFKMFVKQYTTNAPSRLIQGMFDTVRQFTVFVQERITILFPSCSRIAHGR